MPMPGQSTGGAAGTNNQAPPEAPAPPKAKEEDTSNLSIFEVMQRME